MHSPPSPAEQGPPAPGHTADVEAPAPGAAPDIEPRFSLTSEHEHDHHVDSPPVVGKSKVGGGAVGQLVDGEKALVCQAPGVWVSMWRLGPGSCGLVGQAPTNTCVLPASSSCRKRMAWQPLCSLAWPAALSQKGVSF